ncbi:MAG: hypothetical protein ACJ8FY_29105 [Gemmataceae bacterium]
MRFHLALNALPRGIMAGLSMLALALPAVQAQQLSQSSPTNAVVNSDPIGRCPPAPCATDTVPWPAGNPLINPNAISPSIPSDSGTSAAAPALSPGLTAAVGGGRVALTNVGYIDSAIPQSMFRTRFDAAYDNNRPDRAEFFYPKCGCFLQTGPGVRAPGPPLPETRVDYQEITGYIEVAPSDRFSVFAEVPERYINPEQNANQSGIGDINFGFKYAFIAETCRYFTLQLRTFVPTGDPFKGLGTDHTTVEPGLLFYQALSDRLIFESEVRDYVPIGGTNFSGNVVRYGVGLSYLLSNGPNFRVSPVGELVGWTVTNGKEFFLDGNGQGVVKSAAGDTIVNAKVGVRFGFGDLQERGLLSRSDIYVGYGRALTGEVWYKDIFRLEYRMRF